VFAPALLGILPIFPGSCSAISPLFFIILVAVSALFRIFLIILAVVSALLLGVSNFKAYKQNA
jgi:hypothetical protein